MDGDPGWCDDEQLAVNTVRRWAEGGGSLTPHLAQLQTVISRFPESWRVLFYAGRLLIRAGFSFEAAGFFQKALKLEPSSAQIERHLNSIKNLLVERWHYRMLNDKRRNLAYRDAILSKVGPNSTVLDIGCGTGILSFYAVEAGAKNVLSCDSSDVMHYLTEECIKLNAPNKVTLLHKSSHDIDIDKHGGRVTTVITEVFDGGLFGERALQTLTDAWERLLIPPPVGKIIPLKASLHICGIQSEIIAKKYRLIRSDRNNLFSYIKFDDLNVCQSTEEPYDTEDLSNIADLKYLTSSANIINVDFQNIDELTAFFKSTPIVRLVNLDVVDTGTLDAFVMWFDLYLTEEIMLTSDPRSPERCSAWDPAIFHRIRGQPVNIGDKRSIELRWINGKIELNDNINTDHKVCTSKDVIRILNDAEYINSIIGAVGASCIHLVQLYPFENIKVLDYTPFPIIGLLMLLRGINHLVCSSTSKELISKLATCNNIDMKKILFLDVVEYNSIDTYEMIVNYFVEPLGEIRYADINSLNVKKMHLLKSGGIIMPHRLKMAAKLVSSEHLVQCNKVDDLNLSDGESPTFRIANHINTYQVTQNSFAASDTFPKTYLSDEVTIYRQCLNPRLWETVEVCVTADGYVNAIQSYFKIQLIPHGEELSTDRINSHVNNTYHLIDPPILVKKGDKVEILVFSENVDSIKMILDAN